MIYLFLALAGATFLLTSCNDRPENTSMIRIVEGHHYMYEIGKGYQHDSKCPECQKLNQKLTTEQLSSN